MYAVCSKYHSCVNKECFECNEYETRFYQTSPCGCNRERLLELLDCVENFAFVIEEEEVELCEDLLWGFSEDLRDGDFCSSSYITAQCAQFICSQYHMIKSNKYPKNKDEFIRILNYYRENI